MKNWQKIKNNNNLWKRYFIREKIIQGIREFLIHQKFHEVETPLLVSKVIPESYLDVFETTLYDRRNKNIKMYLTTSPESSIKKLLVAGIGNCFEITKSFRNKETDSCLHNPEFTILEWYRINATYQDLMKDCESLLNYLYKKIIKQKNQLIFQNKIIDLSPPWEKISVVDAFKKYAKINFDEIVSSNNYPFSVDKILKIALKKGYSANKNNTWEEIFNQIFLNEIEPNLKENKKPIIIYDYPKPLAALAKTKKENPLFAERFELYIGGLEIADCYSELTDEKEQEQRFKEELGIMKAKGKNKIIQDEDFLEALKIGLPECSGIAVGVDRLVMLFSDASSIEETLLFPIKDFL